MSKDLEVLKREAHLYSNAKWDNFRVQRHLTMQRYIDVRRRNFFNKQLLVYVKLLGWIKIIWDKYRK